MIKAKAVPNDLAIDFGNAQVRSVVRDELSQRSIERRPIRYERQGEILDEAKQCISVVFCRLPNRYDQLSLAYFYLRGVRQ